MRKLADTRPLGIGSMGAGASGLRGRNPGAPPSDKDAGHHAHAGDPNSFGFAVWQLKDGEEKVIAERLVQIFNEAPKA